jgi:FkbM family methyltransferase
MSVSRKYSVVSSIAHTYPFYSGCGTIANSRLMDVIAPPLPDLVWARSVGGEVLVPLDDLVGRALYFFGDLDPKVTWVIRRLLEPGDVALDIGANLGFLSLLMAKIVGAHGAVHAFEPNPVLCRMLEQTFARNQGANVKLHPVALGASTAEMELHVPKANFGAASLVRQKSGLAQAHAVRVLSLDDLVAQESIARPGFVKLDVEGFELDVLKGAQKLFSTCRPTILFESNDRPGSREVTPVMKWLDQHGYRFIVIPPRVLRMRTRVMDYSRPGDIVGHDIVAVSEGPRFEAACQRLRAD